MKLTATTSLFSYWVHNMAVCLEYWSGWVVRLQLGGKRLGLDQDYWAELNLATENVSGNYAPTVDKSSP